MTSNFPVVRPRRLRRTEQLRNIVRETQISLNDLIYPIFIEENTDEFKPIKSMPGITRIPEKFLEQEIEAIAKDGIKSVMLFGVSHQKDSTGSDSLQNNGLLARMIKKAKSAAPHLVVMADICFCDYTDHGHCGVIEHGHVHNDKTLANLAAQAVIAAHAGADIVAPSSMMDGQVQAIRGALDHAGLTEMPIMAYSTKFASCFYEPFRAAAGCDLKGDRKTYQMDPMNAREAIRESLLDEGEGADFLMVKPGMPYLDILAKIREQTLLPLAVYQVSGEYAMIKFAAAAGALNEARAIRESLGAFKRAGADLVLTYFARTIAREGF